MAAPALWTPVPILGLLHVPQPSPATLRAMALATSTLLALIVAGVGTRLALVIVLGLELLQEAFSNSLGKVTHATLPLLYALAFFTLAPCDRGFSLGAMWRRARRAAADPAFTLPPVRTSRFARWPLDLLFIVLAGLLRARRGLEAARRRPRLGLLVDPLRPADAAVVEVALRDAGELDDVEVGRQVEVARRDERAGLAVEDVRIRLRAAAGRASAAGPARRAPASRRAGSGSPRAGRRARSAWSRSLPS